MNSSIHVTTAQRRRVASSGVEACADAILETVPRTMRLIRKEMRHHAAPRLTVAQLRALLYVERNPAASLSAVAEHLGISRPAGSALVDRLVRAGQLERTPDPAERRRLQLRLTPDGQARVAQVQGRARAWLRDELGRLDAAELDGLQASLAILARIGTEPEEPRP